MSLSANELRRYDRQIILEKLGKAGQEKLKNASILVVGAGGLGCPALQYLTAAGVGRLGIIDDDLISESNLHRQILFTENDIGKAKVDIAKKRLLAQNPFIEIKSYNEKLSKNNALERIKDYDIVLDGSDNFSTKYLLNDACILLNRVLIFASIYDFEGHVSVFNYQNGPSYRCLFPEIPDVDTIPSCSEHGVIGVLPGIIGSIQANEAIKVITGIGDVLSSKLLIFNLLTMKSECIHFSKDERNFQITELADYDFSCDHEEQVTEIDYKELVQLENYSLIDVRETDEYKAIHLSASIHIPLAQIEAEFQEGQFKDTIVFCCKTGVRSKQAIRLLRKKTSKNLLNLKAGIDSLRTNELITPQNDSD